MKFNRITFFALLVLSLCFSPLTRAQDEIEIEITQPEGQGIDPLAEFFDYAKEDSVMRVAIVLSDIYSKKDMEFTRGMLMGIKNAGLPESSVSLKVVNGEIPSDSLVYELDSFGPHIIFSTFEKDSPIALRSYVRGTDAALVNVFDSKSDDYLYNRNVYQLLSPTDKFNSSISSFMTGQSEGKVLVLLGEPDPADPVVRDLLLNWPEDDILIASMTDFDVFEFDDGVNYLIYPLVNNNEEAKEALKQIVNHMVANPSAGVNVVGRPNWISFSDLPNMIANMEVFIPVRCYFDASAPSSKRFIANYNAMFGHAPIRSYPVYSVMGYDAAIYFLPGFMEMRAGRVDSWEPRIMEQSFFDMRRSQAGGYFNNGNFILHYEPWGSMTREPLD